MVDAVREGVLAELLAVAPEVDAAGLADGRPLRDQVELDSMDWLRFLAGVETRLGVTVAEKDYRTLVTLSDLVTYVAQRRR